MANNKDDMLVALTETSIQNANIEKISFTRVTAKMEPNDNETRITLDYGGVLDGSFFLTQAPPDDSLTVKRAVLDILGQIDLQKLCTNVEAAAALLDVAYNACNGIGGAHENLYQLRTEVFTAVADSVDMSDKFRKATNAIIMAMLNVYETLSSVENCDVDSARMYLAAVKKAAKGLAEQADDMSKRFILLEGQALSEGKNIVGIEVTNIKERAALQKQLADFESQLDAFNASKTEIEKQITQAQALYAKYDKEASELNKKADTMEIVGMVVGGLGAIAGGVSSAVSGYIGASTPKININSAPPTTPVATQTPNSSSTPNTNVNPSVSPSGATGNPAQQDTPDVVARNTRIGSNKAELGLIEARYANYAKKIETLENEKKAADKTRSDSIIDAEITETKTKQSNDSKRKSVLEAEIKSDESYLNAKATSSGGKAIEDAMVKAESKVDNIANNARSAAAAKDKLAQEMIRLKFELEGKNVENLTRIAEFTQRIKNANIDVIDTSVIINSLQLAVTCLSTVGATLASVALFWSSIETACASLADNTTIDALSNSIDSKEGNPESLVKYVTTNNMFGKNWFIMECQWQALNLVCNAYYMSCNNAYNMLDASFRRVETAPREHWKRAQEMAKVLEEKLNVSLRSAQSKDADFKKRVEIAQQEKDKMLLEISNS